MKLVSRQLSEAYGEKQPINFSLYFNKMLPFHDNFTYREIERKKGQENEKGIKDTFKPCEGEFNGKRFRDEQYGPFRQHHLVYSKSTALAADILKQRQLQQAAYCQAMEAARWRSFIVHAELTSPFVSGLGMAHPTETGLVLDHTSGMPFIPAASQKGVLRVAHLINSLCDEQGKWLPEKVLKEKGIINDKMEWREDDASKTLFGSGGDKDALAGQVVVLDAYPLTPPELGEEILSPHFGDYYQQKKRDGKLPGPTEDQSPIPIKFLVVKPGANFVFRLLLRTPFSKTNDQNTLICLMEKTLHRAITEEGMGAKTALGFGRFKITACSEPEKIQAWRREEESKRYPWRPLAQKIKSANDWGQLRQLLDNQEVKQYQANPEIGQAAHQKAIAIRDANPKKWEEARDAFMNEWLQTSGLKWTTKQAVQTIENSTPALSSEEQAAVEEVQALNGWSKEIISLITTLPLAALNSLRDRMKKEWGCAENRAKKDKKQAWTLLTTRLRELKNA